MLSESCFFGGGVGAAPRGETGEPGDDVEEESLLTIGDPWTEPAEETERNFTRSLTEVGVADDSVSDEGVGGVSLIEGVERSFTSPKGEEGIWGWGLPGIFCPDLVERSLTSPIPPPEDDVEVGDELFGFVEVLRSFFWKIAPLLTSLIILSKYSPECLKFPCGTLSTSPVSPASSAFAALAAARAASAAAFAAACFLAFSSSSIRRFVSTMAR